MFLLRLVFICPKNVHPCFCFFFLFCIRCPLCVCVFARAVSLPFPSEVFGQLWQTVCITEVATLTSCLIPGLLSLIDGQSKHRGLQRPVPVRVRCEEISQAHTNFDALVTTVFQNITYNFLPIRGRVAVSLAGYLMSFCVAVTMSCVSNLVPLVWSFLQVIPCVWVNPISSASITLRRPAE